MNANQQISGAPVRLVSALHLAPAASRPAAPRFDVLQGVGPQAAYLDAQWACIAGQPSPAEMGWQVPPAARIGVALAGVKDSDWSLDADEMAF